MSNLIKNEFIKIFKKKSTYIILIITLGFIVFSNFMYKNIGNHIYTSGYDEETIKYYEENMPEEHSTNSEENEVYVDMKARLDMMKLMQKYGFNSWQSYVIQNDIDFIGYLDIITEYEHSIKKDISEKQYNDAKADYDKFVQKLDANDWKYFVNTELDEVNAAIAATKEDGPELYDLQVKKQVLEWRLEKDISYEGSFLNTCLDNYYECSQSVYSYEHSSKHEYSETLEYNNAVERFNKSKYYIENNINNISDSDNRGILLDLFENYELFILIFIIMIAGAIVSDEFSKGTVKLLLVRPYSRIKILFAKFIVCLLILALSIVFIALSQYVIGGVIQGFDSTNVSAVVYNHNTHSIETMTIAKYITTTAIAKMPVYILLMTLAFACSTLFTNTAVAIVIPLLGYMGSALINQLALIYNIKAISYFVTPNWDLTYYLFGGLPDFEGLTMPFSIGVCLVYFAIMVVTMFIVFKKRDIKNI